MNPVMLLSFSIPVAITLFLVALMIKEKTGSVSEKKQMVYSEKTKVEENQPKHNTDNEPYYEKLISKNKKDLDDYVDYSGGIMGI